MSSLHTTMPYAFLAAGFSAIGAGLLMWEQVERGARYRRFSAITQLVTGSVLILMGIFSPRVPAVYNFAWAIVVIVPAVAVWQVASTIRDARARRLSEAQRLSAATGVASEPEQTARLDLRQR